MSGYSTVTRKPARKGRVNVTGCAVSSGKPAWQKPTGSALGGARVPRPASEPSGVARVKQQAARVAASGSTALTMSLHFFGIPALYPGAAQAELNRFCQAHRVVAGLE